MTSMTVNVPTKRGLVNYDLECTEVPSKDLITSANIIDPPMKCRSETKEKGWLPEGGAIFRGADGGSRQTHCLPLKPDRSRRVRSARPTAAPLSAREWQPTPRERKNRSSEETKHTVEGNSIVPRQPTPGATKDPRDPTPRKWKNCWSEVRRNEIEENSIVPWKPPSGTMDNNCNLCCPRVGTVDFDVE
ncbi:hypothetical protein WN48_01382 [Eufriesea mexicana]|uniref:Uncharacterized protein n=1 Tax=Eufriesea mexicana TaxID=516756 RepID=A0A310SKX0_9HYME|nr:hypothetical protein WN48_01382 [Eufriesea mexicana]